MVHDIYKQQKVSKHGLKMEKSSNMIRNNPSESTL